jgi:hypothetical protein
MQYKKKSKTEKRPLEVLFVKVTRLQLTKECIMRAPIQAEKRMGRHFLDKMDAEVVILDA